MKTKHTTKCRTCGKCITESNRRCYCCELCYRQHWNDKAKLNYHKTAPLPRKPKVILCECCKKFVKHQPCYDNDITTIIYKKGRQRKEMMLEISHGKTNWHYINKRPVSGEKKARQQFRLACQTLVKRGWGEVLK